MKITTDNLDNINVVITGAARGLGAALSIVLADEGCNIVLCGRSQDALEKTADQIETRTGRRPEIVVLDLAHNNSVESAIEEINNRLPAVDVLINNGMTWLERNDTPYKASDVVAVFNSALTGTFLFTQGLIPLLMKSIRPDVVIIGAIHGIENVSLQNVSVPFYAAKHGQTGLANGLRQMFLKTPIRSISIQPPWLDEISPLDNKWNTKLSNNKDEMVSYRDVVETVLFAITRPRHVTIASLVIDNDKMGMHNF